MNAMLQTDGNVFVSQIEPTNTTGTNILDLNDDCLLEIFSSKLLTALDLCILAETCTRFKRITQYACPKYFEVGADSYGFFSKNQSTYTTERAAQRILKTFGPCFSTVSMQRHDLVAVDWVAKHCSALKMLKIYRFVIDESAVLKLRSIFRQIVALHITSSLVTAGTKIDCTRLIELEIVDVLGCDAIFNNTFPTLQRFTFADDNYSGTTALAFIGRHNGLRTLSLDTKSLYRMHDFTHVIDNSCRELEKLTLRKFNNFYVAPDFSSFKGPAKLKILDVNLGYKHYSHIVALLQGFKSLEIVKLSMGLFHDDVRGVLVALSELEHLRELHLKNCYYERTPWSVLSRLKKLCLFDSMFPFPSNVLFSIISGLTNLHQLEIRTEFALNEEEFSEIVKIIERRTHALTIKSRIDFSENFSKNCNKNEKIKLIKLD